ncbi:MAG: ATP-dependent Clp protease proteolytic subunit [Akkermansia muciniphila]
MNYNDNICSMLLSGNIGAPMVYKLLEELKHEAHRSKDILRLFIDSNGGMISSALTMARFLMSAFSRIETYAIGSVDSAAVTLFLCGEKRFASDSSRFFLHPAGIEMKGIMTAPQLQTVLRGLQTESACMVRYYAQRTALPLTFWQQLLENESYLDAAGAREKHIVTEIGWDVPPFPPDGIIITA